MALTEATDRRLQNLQLWRKGTSPNPGGLQRGKRYTELHGKLLAELGGNLTAIEAVLLDKAVTLLLRRTKNNADVVKLTSEARRILNRLRADCAAKTTPSMTLAEYAAAKYENTGS